MLVTFLLQKPNGFLHCWNRQNVTTSDGKGGLFLRLI